MYMYEQKSAYFLVSGSRMNLQYAIIYAMKYLRPIHELVYFTSEN